MRRAVALLAALAFATSGCELVLQQESSGTVAKNQCERDSDCAGGLCRNAMCVTHQGDFDTLLLSVTPPTDAPGVGGIRYLSIRTGLGRTNQDFPLDVPHVSTITGFFSASDSSCGTVPVEVTLTPTESSYGLPSVSYVARSTDSKPTGPCSTPGLGLPSTVPEFVLDAPKGSYDMYVRPVPIDPVPAGCVYVPALFRDFLVSDAAAQCRPLTLATPETLPFVIQSPKGGSLDGWIVDMVHPITENRISDQVTLPTASAQGTYSPLLHYSRDPTLRAGKEIVRLTPPSGASPVIAPTLYFEVSGLLATSVAATPPLGLFPDPVKIESWVWSAKDFAANVEVPVVGHLTFTARKLLGVADGVIASFTATAESNGKDPIQATLLPGTYRVRIEPQAGLGYAETETELEVPCDWDPVTPGQCLPGTGVLPASRPPISGRVLLVLKAASVAGSLIEPVHGDSIDGASVQVAPSVLAEPKCDPDAGTCASRPLHIFDTLLGQDALVPRSATTLSSHGAFVFPEVDCGACTAGNGAVFDLTASPPDGSRLPWFVHPSMAVDVGRVDLGQRRGSLPVVQWGTVQVQQTSAITIPRALIRAYLLRDQDGKAVTDASTPSCVAPSVTTPSANPTPCIRSVLQIAEARGHDDGTFELILPSTFDTAP